MSDNINKGFINFEELEEKKNYSKREEENIKIAKETISEINKINEKKPISNSNIESEKAISSNESSNVKTYVDSEGVEHIDRREKKYGRRKEDKRNLIAYRILLVMVIIMIGLVCAILALELSNAIALFNTQEISNTYTKDIEELRFLNNN